jgi:hypothetical protein
MLTHQRVAPQPARLLQSAQRLTLDHLWVLTVLGLIWLFISVLPLPPNDLWWHMAAGRTMVAEGAWMQTNRWAYTVPFDAPYVYQSWIGEIALYGLWRLGDVPLLALARTLVVVGSYGLVSWHALRRSGQGKAVALALLLAALIGWNNWTLRPQTLALAPGAAFVVVIGERLGGRLRARWLALLPVLMALWVNMHGSFIMGAALIGFVWLGTLWSLLGQPRHRRAALACELRVWTIVGLATLAALLLNPLGLGIVGYLSNLLGNSAVQTRIAEWQPLTNRFNLSDTGFWFYALLLLLAALMASGPRRPSAIDLLWYCGLAWLGISAGRHAMWFALFLLPLLAEQLAPLFARQPRARSNAAINLGFGLLLGGALLATLPWFAPSRYLGPDSAQLYADAGPYRMLLGNMTPVAATDWLERHPIAGRFWTDMSYTSYTTWRMPEKQVFADLRIELFPDAVWDDYFEIAEGGAGSVELIDRWQITHLLLDAKGQAALQQRLAATPGWCERYRDSRAVIMARCP